jgi:hypothetical protein
MLRRMESQVGFSLKRLSTRMSFNAISIRQTKHYRICIWKDRYIEKKARMLLSLEVTDETQLDEVVSLT